MNTLFLLFIFFFPPQEEIRIIKYNGSNVRTTFKVDNRFLGKYEGRKEGFLELREDGTGSYKYDVFGFAKPGCKNETIQFEWGFLIDSDNELVKFERDYGYSFPMLMQTISETSFQGCRKSVMLDFIIEREELLSVSSSDDWVK